MSATKKISASNLAKKLNCSLSGDTEVELQGLCALDDQQPGALTFSNSKNSAHVLNILKQAKCAAIIVNSSLELPEKIENKVAVLHCQSAFNSFLKAVNIIQPEPVVTRQIAKTAKIAKSAKIGSNVAIGEYVVIGENCEIADNVVIHPHVVIYDNVKIGQNCVLHAHCSVREDVQLGAGCVLQNGSCIGADGFGYIPDGKGELQTVRQVGNVVLADTVEVGANSCIDRAMVGSTRVGRNSKIDNLVQVGHNVQIGSNSILCGQVGIAGSSKIGDHCILGGNVGVADHVSITSRVRVAGKSAVTQDIKEHGDYGGYPAVKASRWRRQLIAIKKLAERIKAES